MRMRFDDLSVMARTVFGEARGEPYQGRLAVAHVILNRVRAGGWFGASVSEVCLKRWQFSCWNPGDPNRARLFQVELDDRDLLDCSRACLEAVSGSEYGRRHSLPCHQLASHTALGARSRTQCRHRTTRFLP
jgi:hypothetical protein